MTQEEKAKRYEQALERARLFSEHPLQEDSANIVEYIFPELAEPNDEKIRKEIVDFITSSNKYGTNERCEEWLNWLKKQGEPTEINPSEFDLRLNKLLKQFESLPKEELITNLSYYLNVIQNDGTYKIEKQGEQKSTQEIEPFEAEHGKYYYCIKDYFCGGRKQASKGDVVQALRGLPIMGLKDASEYFLPVNFIKCNFAWSEEDESLRLRTIGALETCKIGSPTKCVDEQINWLKSLKERVQPQPKQEWSEEDEAHINSIIDYLLDYKLLVCEEDMNVANGVQKELDWLESIKNRRLKL